MNDEHPPARKAWNRAYVNLRNFWATQDKGELRNSWAALAVQLKDIRYKGYCYNSNGKIEKTNTLCDDLVRYLNEVKKLKYPIFRYLNQKVSLSPQESLSRRDLILRCVDNFRRMPIEYSDHMEVGLEHCKPSLLKATELIEKSETVLQSGPKQNLFYFPKAIDVLKEDLDISTLKATAENATSNKLRALKLDLENEEKGQDITNHCSFREAYFNGDSYIMREPNPFKREKMIREKPYLKDLYKKSKTLMIQKYGANFEENCKNF